MAGNILSTDANTIIYKHSGFTTTISSSFFKSFDVSSRCMLGWNECIKFWLVW